MKPRHILQAIVFLYLSSGVLPALAGYSVDPMQLFLSAAPGETQIRSLRAINTGDTPVSLRISAMEYTKGTEGEETPAEPGAVGRGCAGWVGITPGTIELPPRGEKTVSLSLAVPPDASGSYWCNIRVSQLATPAPPRLVKAGGTVFRIITLQDMLVRVIVSGAVL